MTTYIEFECGGGTILTGQAAVDAVAEHKAHCPDCPGTTIQLTPKEES